MTPRAWLGWLVPLVTPTEVLLCLRQGLIGAGLAGAYGMVHDQITYGISREYFTRFKCIQFGYADFGFGERWFVATIGFLATWWVGFFALWFITRHALSQGAREQAGARASGAIATILAGAVAGGLAGYALGTARAHLGGYEDWQGMAEELQVIDIQAFVTVGYIHNAGYLGAAVGLVIAILRLRRQHARGAAPRPPQGRSSS